VKLSWTYDDFMVNVSGKLVNSVYGWYLVTEMTWPPRTLAAACSGVLAVAI